jgi:hypothetical protein
MFQMKIAAIWKSVSAAALGALASAMLFQPTPAKAQSEPFVGQLIVVGFSFCPRGWAAADGQLLPVSQNPTLFSLLGTTYGGDGRTTFALPDLERVLFSWKQSEWMNFSHLTRRRPQSDAVASVEDFDDVRAEKTPPAVR